MPADAAKLAIAIAEKLLSVGAHSIREQPFEIHGRTCKHYFEIGVFDVVELREVEVAKAFRGKQYFSVFLNMLMYRILSQDEHYAIQLSNIVNSRLEDFVIRLGFRAIGPRDYLLLYHDMRDSQARLRTILRDTPTV